jgi:5-methylcytosine-specific restriction endonuclease McrA
MANSDVFSFQSCPCIAKADSFRTLSNGTEQWGYQCLACGKFSVRSRKSFTCRPNREFDPAIRDSFYEQQITASKQFYTRKRAAERDAWMLRHDAYLRSEKWRKLRGEALKRDKYLCQGCLSAQASCVHHLSYDHHQNELLFELVSLCSACHDRAHTKGDRT